jgi:hypothetical protein
MKMTQKHVPVFMYRMRFCNLIKCAINTSLGWGQHRSSKKVVDGRDERSKRSWGAGWRGLEGWGRRGKWGIGSPPKLQTSITPLAYSIGYETVTLTVLLQFNSAQ